MPDVLSTALAPSARLSSAVKPGKQALTATDRSRVTEASAKVTDSLALDEEYAQERANAPRWDYLAGVERTSPPRISCVIGIEVHPATPGEVKRVISKQLSALETLGAEKTPSVVSHWYWIASGKVGISRTTSEFRLLQKHRIELVGHLSVKGC